MYTGPSDCSGGAIVSADPSDCHAFHQCSGLHGVPAFRRSCGYLLFNPITLTCDWPDEVVRIRPECSKTFSVFGAGDVGGGNYNYFGNENSNNRKKVNKDGGKKRGKTPKAVFKGERDESSYQAGGGERRRRPGPRFDDGTSPTTTGTTAPGHGQTQTSQGEDRGQVYFPSYDGGERSREEEEEEEEKLPELFVPGGGRNGQEVEEEKGVSEAIMPMEEGKDETRDEEQRAPTTPAETSDDNGEDQDYYGYNDDYAPPLEVTADSDEEGSNRRPNEIDSSMGQIDVATSIMLKPQEEEDESLLSVILGLDDGYYSERGEDEDGGGGSGRTEGRPRKLDGDVASEEENNNNVGDIDDGSTSAGQDDDDELVFSGSPRDPYPNSRDYYDGKDPNNNNKNNEEGTTRPLSIRNTLSSTILSLPHLRSFPCL